MLMHENVLCTSKNKGVVHGSYTPYALCTTLEAGTEKNAHIAVASTISTIPESFHACSAHVSYHTS